MLTIKRVPTVVSNYQDNGGCNGNCLGRCCLRGAVLPLYAFGKAQVPNKELDPSYFPYFSFLDTLLLGKWEDCMRKGLFRYDVMSCKSKIISGKHGFIAQLNEGRHFKKRPTEFRVDQVLQPFDFNKFNFTKIGQEEILFMFQESVDDSSHYHPRVPLGAYDAPNVVAINVSPIEFGHVLLIPRILDCLAQKIDRQSFLLALHMAVSAANPFFRLGYNSLGAFATINHLHFQAYYLSTPFPIENAATQTLSSMENIRDGCIQISKLLNYPVRGFVFEDAPTLEDMANVVSCSCTWLQDNNVPFNVLISDAGGRVFLLPQCFAEKQALGMVSQEILETQVNPAVWEISGHIVLKRQHDFDAITEDFTCRLLIEASLSEQRFEEVECFISDIIEVARSGGIESNFLEKDTSLPSPSCATSISSICS